MDPGQEIVHEAFREALGPMKAFEEEAPEDFHDGGRVGRGKRQELTIGNENAVGNQGMGMRIEVGAVATVGRQGKYAAGADVRAVKECLEGFQNRGVGGLGQKAEQPAVTFDETAQDAGDGKGPVTMGEGSQDV